MEVSFQEPYAYRGSPGDENYAPMQSADQLRTVAIMC